MEKTSICLKASSEGIRLRYVCVQRIKRFIEKHGMIYPPTKCYVNNCKHLTWFAW